MLHITFVNCDDFDCLYSNCVHIFIYFFTYIFSLWIVHTRTGSVVLQWCQSTIFCLVVVEVATSSCGKLVIVLKLERSKLITFPLLLLLPIPRPSLQHQSKLSDLYLWGILDKISSWLLPSKGFLFFYFWI